MKTKAILFASVLLAGCQSGLQPKTPAQQHTQKMSSTNQKTDGIAEPEDSANWKESPTAQQDLWGHIRDELKMEIPSNSRMLEQQNDYLKHKSYLQNVTLRASPYIYWIVEQLDKREMPMELVLLPIVESAFNPYATSYAKAAGIWQIIPSTGRHYGLTQDKWYDARRDVAASTTAALDMFERLNKRFNGDWLLTIAAYNSGEGRVMRAIKDNEAKGKPTDFWSLSLPRETMNYVPKILALSNIIRYNEQFGFKVPEPSHQQALTKVEVGQPIMLSQAADLSGLSLTSIRAYNPGYKQGMTSPDGPHYIMLPKKNVNQFKTSLADDSVLKDVRLAVVHNTRKLQQQGRYTVRAGDTLSAIAKRFNTTHRELQKLNSLKTADRLKIGQVLKVDNSSPVTYRVRKGDSFSSIAKRHGVNLNDLMNWNKNIKIKEMKPGIALTLYLN
ncbi:lytic murein transglycosylase C, membrane-bound [Xenorhabdus nematophila ATCC 19061]|uniref:peptidoglycan lytic exotransglycosylase n=1 Tax=Xenorhabdus nematophila (strain ATCC 19061 / DSM 3370 / CCUG 14189 / LMG 1036 / NCIMB 9965 / AN6) TaxID=406817 RepID=D3VAW2_XENNA|nr:murein transglycosylase D [Xenorhabdus nematophila]CBJ91737.1 lytic murein transglycosylase C, membrane-bound [Xenorhabdus nematophila ATCC 19061]CEK24555.1 lytic murein transglycosylase C, membrane-bound [Xenorhabdus nematophila AN6/1]